MTDTLATCEPGVTDATALRRAPDSEPIARRARQRWMAWEQRTSELDVLLGGGDLEADTEVAVRLERATLLAHMGRNVEARDDHLKVLAFDPAHRQNLVALGRVLVALGRLKAAQMVYLQAVKHHPDNIVCRVNLGAVLLEREDYAAAREQYQAALRIDPRLPQAHGGMYYALRGLGEPEAAARHQRIAFEQQNLIAKPYRGPSRPVPVLLLVSSAGGNTPIEKLLDERVFQTWVVVTDFLPRETPLPPHDLVVNGIADADVSEQALLAAQALVAHTAAPVVNPPAVVLATGRCGNAGRLRDVPGLIAPATASFPRAVLAGPEGPETLRSHGFAFPLLLRSPGFHMGQNFVRVEEPADLAAAVAGLPGPELLAMEYLDARGADGRARKYRVMMIDGGLYPLHVAISSHWKIHYFSADMAESAENRREDDRFLCDMAGVLGDKAMAALESLQAMLGLDYGGVDFGLNRQGELLLFEANAAMVVQEPDEGEKWNYRRPAVRRIHAAVRRMLMARAGAETFAKSTQAHVDAARTPAE